MSVGGKTYSWVFQTIFCSAVVGNECVVEHIM